jgi:hypothetical protein
MSCTPYVISNDRYVNVKKRNFLLQKPQVVDIQKASEHSSHSYVLLCVPCAQQFG